MTRKHAPVPLDILRVKVNKHSSDILALKAAVVDLQSRCAKVETALGIVASGDMPPSVEREDPRSEEG